MHKIYGIKNTNSKIILGIEWNDSQPRNSPRYWPHCSSWYRLGSTKGSWHHWGRTADRSPWWSSPSGWCHSRTSHNSRSWGRREQHSELPPKCPHWRRSWSPSRDKKILGNLWSRRMLRTYLAGIALNAGILGRTHVVAPICVALVAGVAIIALGAEFVGNFQRASLEQDLGFKFKQSLGNV